MRTVDVATLTQNIKEMCIEANHFLSEDMKTAFTKAEQQENLRGSRSCNSCSRIWILQART